MVIVGRSDAAGNTLTQDDILAEVLQRQTGYTVYGYAPAGLDDFLRDPRFLQMPPAVLIFVNTERGLYELAPLTEARGQGASPPPLLVKRLYARLLPKPASLLIDRIRKKPWLSAHLYRLWTRQHIHPTSSGLPDMDDHILHMIIRGYGKQDQTVDALTTLATYTGLPAFWRLVKEDKDAGAVAAPVMP